MNSYIGIGLSISFSLTSLPLAGSWFFFGDTVVIIGETPSRSEPHTNFLAPSDTPLPR